MATDGNDTLNLAGLITAGSFTGSQVTAQIETDQSDASLLTECGAKGIKKITFGMNGAPSSCMNGPKLRAAITNSVNSPCRSSR